MLLDPHETIAELKAVTAAGWLCGMEPQWLRLFFHGDRIDNRDGMLTLHQAGIVEGSDVYVQDEMDQCKQCVPDSNQLTGHDGDHIKSQRPIVSGGDTIEDTVCRSCDVPKSPLGRSGFVDFPLRCQGHRGPHLYGRFLDRGPCRACFGKRVQHTCYGY